jgi:thioredoxin reductase (NADPH)
MKTLVLERAVMGGQIINTDAIENYPGISKEITGVDLITEAEAQATKFGAEYGFGEVTKIDFKSGPPFKLWTDEEEYHAKAVIVTTVERGRGRIKLGARACMVGSRRK